MAHWVRGRLLVEPRRPSWVRELAIAPWLVVATVCIGAFMGQLDASIVTVALPTLSEDFDAPVGLVLWVSLSYLLVLISLITTIGRFADMAGRKLLYLYGFAVFVVGSALCAAAPSLWILILARALQGIGAAMLQANSVALIVHAVPRSRLGRAIGVQGAAQAVGLGLGPALGGVLLAIGGWRLIFLVNVPAGIAAFAIGWVMLPRSRELSPREPFDWLGTTIFVPAVALLLLAISAGSAGIGLLPAIGLVVASFVLLAVFVACERRSRSPMLRLSMFAHVAFSAGISSGPAVLPGHIRRSVRRPLSSCVSRWAPGRPRSGCS